jgi:trk system potassium uptake protein TrkA
MGRFAVIGLGKFGGYVTRALYDKGHEVIAIDKDPATVQEMRDRCTQAIVADCTDQATLRALSLGDAEAVVLSLGESMDASILVTLYLREMGVKRIIVKAISQDHGKVLELIGATEIVHPERDSAIRVASALGSRALLEYLPLGVGFSLAEIAVPRHFINKTLAGIQLRSRFQVTVVAVKNGERLDLVPGGDQLLKDGDILVLVGTDEHIGDVAREVG